MPLEDIIFYLSQISVGSDYLEGSRALKEAIDILTQIENDNELKSKLKSPIF